MSEIGEFWFVEALPSADRKRPWSLAHYQSHRTFRATRRGPFRGRVQALVEDSGRRCRTSRKRR